MRRLDHDLFPGTMPGDSETVTSATAPSPPHDPGDDPLHDPELGRLASFVSGAALQTASQAKANDATRRVVIPFDFVSKFDDGEYGRTMGDMIWTKLRRQGGFILPESMQDVRDWCQRTKMIPGPDTSLTR